MGLPHEIKEVQSEVIAKSNLSMSIALQPPSQVHLIMVSALLALHNRD